MIGLADRFRHWAYIGDDEAILKAREDLRTRVASAEGEAKLILQVALTMTEGIKSPFDPPLYPGEPLAFRGWRTVERLREEAGIELPEEEYTRFSRINGDPNQEAEFLDAVRKLVSKAL